MRIYYISSSAWWDTDITILPLLQKQYCVMLLGIDQRKVEQTAKLAYPPFEQWCEEVCLMRQKWRGRSLLTMLQTFLYSIKIVCRIREKNAINFYVIGANNLYFSLFLYFLLPKTNTAIVIHNFEEHTDMRKSLFSRVKAMYYNRFRKFCFFSELQRQNFLAKYNKQAYTLKMPLKDYGKNKIARYDDKIKLLFFGTIRDYKGLDILIKGINRKKSENIKVIIAGQCKEWEKYEKLIENNDIYESNIGFVPDDAIADYFCNADFIVLPYRDATQSGPSLIALNYGIPIIASDLPAFRNLIIDGENGFLFKAEDVDSLSGVIEKVNRMKKEEITRMKKAQLDVKTNYCSDNLLSSFEAMVREMGL